VRLAVAPLGLVLLVGLLAGCMGDDDSSTDPSALDGVPWVHVSGVNVDGWEDAPPSATFEDGRLTGSTGCNRYSGQYTAGDGTLEIQGLALTRMACAPPADEVEREFVAALESVERFRVEGEELVLRDGEDDEVLRFAVATPVGSWSATGLLRGDAFQTIVPGTEITITFDEEGEVSGSGGCNTYTATYEIDAATIQISPPAATRLTCSEPAGAFGIMEQEQAYLAVLPTAASYRLDGGTLQLLADDGTGLVSYSRAP
jgi:heat shock protein HslJ